MSASRPPKHRFYLEQQAGVGDLIALDRKESRHLMRVLRLKPGHNVEIFDPAGQGYLAEVAPFEGKHAQLQVLSALAPSPEAALPFLGIAMSMIKRRALEMAIEKLSELGVHQLQLLHTAHSESHTDLDSAQQSHERWERIALTAAKQCGRNRPLEILSIQTLEDWLDARETDSAYIFGHITESAPALADHLATHEIRRGLWALIGPEGGWTSKEIELLIEARIEPVTMGALVLRAETAAIAAAACFRLRAE